MNSLYRQIEIFGDSTISRNRDFRQIVFTEKWRFSANLLYEKSRFSANALAADGALLGAARRPIGACWYLTCSAKCARPTGAPLGEISEAFDASGPQELQQTDLRP